MVRIREGRKCRLRVTYSLYLLFVLTPGTYSSYLLFILTPGTYSLYLLFILTHGTYSLYLLFVLTPGNCRNRLKARLGSNGYGITIGSETCRPNCYVVDAFALQHYVVVL